MALASEDIIYLLLRESLVRIRLWSLTTSVASGSARSKGF